MPDLTGEPADLLGRAALCGTLLLLAAALWSDLRRREIPNRLVAGVALLWAVAALLAPGWIGAAPAAGLACGGMMLLIGWGLHAAGWLGGGDGKLLAALALWLGPADLGLALLLCALIGAALLLLACSGRGGDLRRRGIPFACAIAPPGGTLLLARLAAGAA